MTRIALLVMALSFVGCAAPPPNPHAEAAKARIYDAIGDVIVAEIRGGSLSQPEPEPLPDGKALVPENPFAHSVAIPPPSFPSEPIGPPDPEPTPFRIGTATRSP